MTLICQYCGDEVSPRDPFAWRRVVGWERRAVAESRKGGSDIALREPREEFAHDQCVSRVRDGIAPGQEALL